MALDGVSSTSSTQNTSPPPSNGADPKSPEGLQGRFDDIKAGKSENPKEDLKNLKKDVDEATQKEENKAGGGDQDILKMLMKLLEMIMQMMQQQKGGGGAAGAGAEGGE